MSESVSLPRPLLKELYEYFAKIDEILATLEELMDKEGLERTEKSLEEYKKKIIWLQRALKVSEDFEGRNRSPPWVKKDLSFRPQIIFGAPHEVETLERW